MATKKTKTTKTTKTTKAKVEEPKVLSSADLTGTVAGTDPHTANTTVFNREPTATEAKLAEQGLIPPIRR